MWLEASLYTFRRFDENLFDVRKCEYEYRLFWDVLGTEEASSMISEPIPLLDEAQSELSLSADPTESLAEELIAPFELNGLENDRTIEPKKSEANLCSASSFGSSLPWGRYYEYLQFVVESFKVNKDQLRWIRIPRLRSMIDERNSVVQSSPTTQLFHGSHSGGMDVGSLPPMALADEGKKDGRNIQVQDQEMVGENDMSHFDKMNVPRTPISNSDDDEPEITDLDAMEDALFDGM